MRGKIDSLQAIRAIAFLAIFTTHIGFFSPGGTWGVSIFFILSGFLMTYNYFGKNRITKVSLKENIRFSIRKIYKLYPLHIFMMIAVVPYLVFKISNIRTLFSILAKVLLNTALLQAWVPKQDVYFSLNGVAWFFSVSLFLYFMFPYIMYIIEKYNNKNIIILFMVATFIIQIMLGYISSKAVIPVELSDNWMVWFVYIFPLSRLEDFFIGCNLGYLFLKAKNNKKITRLIWTMLEFLVLVLVILQWVIYIYLKPSSEGLIDTTQNLWWLLAAFYTPTSCLLIYVFAVNKGRISNFLQMIFLFIWVILVLIAF
ncbi:MAG: acyltransferase family protein [Liquorilactobacillus hordei]|uniref:acyltransferase family protein n=1 Tax=Liquorilactobacillus hordei TaxID=468911 RepID=UPI0039EBA446